MTKPVLPLSLPLKQVLSEMAKYLLLKCLNKAWTKMSLKSHNAWNYMSIIFIAHSIILLHNIHINCVQCRIAKPNSFCKC